MLRVVMEKSIALGQQITTWLVVGNAGAMVLSFNAVIQGSPCFALIQGSATSFAVGLGLAFGSAVASYVGYTVSLIYLGKVNNAAEKVYVTDAHAREIAAECDGSVEDLRASADAWKAASDAGAEMGTLKARYLWVAPSVAGILLFGSLVAFAHGIMEPLSRPPGEFARCSARESSSQLTKATPDSSTPSRAPLHDEQFVPATSVSH